MTAEIKKLNHIKGQQTNPYGGFQCKLLEWKPTLIPFIGRRILWDEGIQNNNGTVRQSSP